MNRVHALILAAALAATPAGTALAQAPSQGQTFDMRGDQSTWINDPHMHEFYQATVDAFAQGPDHFDRPAYEKRAHEIFWAFALSLHMRPEGMEDHLKRIPREMIMIVKRDPQALASYDNFVVALFGPQRQGPGSAPG